jgi:hypothetical protein
MRQGAEFQDSESPIVSPHALLQEENRSGRGKSDRQADHQKNRKQQRQHRKNAKDVE